MTTPELRRLTRKWQERLRLNDWDIKARFATKDEAKATWGLCTPTPNTKTAQIHIANPRWFKESDKEIEGYLWDPEVTIVHELLHIHFAALNHAKGSHKEVIEEQIVSCIAQLLVALDRRDELVLTPNNPKPLSKVASFK